MRNDHYARLFPAISELTEEYGLRVIVDGSPNAIYPFHREEEMYVDLMSREQIESIPEFSRLMSLLKHHRLDDAVWKVLGGSPLSYFSLETVLFQTTAAYDDVEATVKRYLLSCLYHACNRMYNSSLQTKQAVQFFRENKIEELCWTNFDSEGFQWDPFDGVFRKTRFTIAPSSPAMALIIQHDLRNDPTLCALQDQLFRSVGEDTSTLYCHTSPVRDIVR